MYDRTQHARARAAWRNHGCAPQYATPKTTKTAGKTASSTLLPAVKLPTLGSTLQVLGSVAAAGRARSCSQRILQRLPRRSCLWSSLPTDTLLKAVDIVRVPRPQCATQCATGNCGPCGGTPAFEGGSGLAVPANTSWTMQPLCLSMVQSMRVCRLLRNASRLPKSITQTILVSSRPSSPKRPKPVITEAKPADLPKQVEALEKPAAEKLPAAEAKVDQSAAKAKPQTSTTKRVDELRAVETTSVETNASKIRREFSLHRQST